MIDSRKLFTSILRGIIPPELSFLYIKATNKKKQFQIYAAINYIYASIEAIVYYPFFLIYVEYIHVDDFYGLNKYYQNATLLIAALAEGIIVFFSFVLLLIGLQIKYGRIFYCCEWFYIFLVLSYYKDHGTKLITWKFSSCRLDLPLSLWKYRNPSRK